MNETSLSANATISHYRILSRIGRAGWARSISQKILGLIGPLR